ncbi:MAG: Chromosome partition protein smc [Candidatus Nomurabacteria bacterium GW2011_GWA1_46_11]|uniref:Chromosome partition protein smc n=1 Tax=Candidatus Nomurabacteria bacterium GW2011_GWA1_46_11 TaxID=1618732 RepID=A0A0G1NPU5_9BACT|nr:MAG: Chromosome partition protein smc [Candidatus Nomurabacteria bacterium GW2011_GWA1_46_11]
MRLKTLSLNGFKSFAHKTVLEFESPIVAIVGPNGSGKSNVVEAVRFVLGEQSMKSMRGKGGADLVFKGSKNLSRGTRASITAYFNNADKIFKLWNDAGEDINLNYDVISISREVYSDGVNKYILNGSEVRLKDIHGLLASVHIGSSGHHIISQGEADRILSASARDRKEMVEDALGLRIYQYKIKESERKLERTNENMKEVTLLRRENAPHLKFLEKQVEKLERAKEMRSELSALYGKYLKKEEIYLQSEKNELASEHGRLSGELREVSAKISKTEDQNDASGGKKIEDLRAVEQKVNSLRSEKNELERKIGRIEGMIEAGDRKAKISGRCPMCGSVIAETDPEQSEKKRHETEELEELKKTQASTLAEIRRVENEEKENAALAENFKQDINKEMEALRDLEREKFAWKVREQEVHSALELVKIKEENLRIRKDAFESELKEGGVLLGEDILAYKNNKDNQKTDTTQEELKKKIERIKIKLEDTGIGGGAELMKEYGEVTERDRFLEKELEDLGKSIESLKVLITDLKEKIDTEFKEGVKKINKEFQEFFAILFGGGHASLAVVTEMRRRRKIEFDENEEPADAEALAGEEEGEPEQGIEINVSLPHKKVKDLHAFSGGERSLTSIALLFAMSQVNPPPFLILDETDAALDEANSRKYGDMLEKLSKRSQLIVVTHNRETMSRAGVLYGITIGSDGASKLLSVKFEEATQIAK